MEKHIKIGNLPTVEEFYKQTTGCVINHGDIKKAMIEFAKLHVEACKKEISENVEMIADENQDFRLQNCNCIDYVINKDLILEAYSLENIK